MWAEYRQTGLFSLTQKSRKVGPRSGPSCREETANAVHHPEREEGFENGIATGLRIWGLTVGQVKLGSWLVEPKEGRGSPCLSLSWGAMVYGLLGEGRTPQFPPPAVGCMGSSPSLQLFYPIKPTCSFPTLPSRAHTEPHALLWRGSGEGPVPLPSRGEGPQVCVSHVINTQ